MNSFAGPVNKIFAWVSLGVIFGGFAANPSFAQAAAKLSYDQFIKLVVKQHPENDISTKYLLKAKETAKRAGILSDPQVTIGRDQVPLPGRFQQMRADAAMSENKEPDESNAQWQVGLSQSFPWPGTLSAESRAANAVVEAVESDVARLQLERRFAATELYLRMVRVSKLIAIQKSNLAVAESVKNFAHEKFKQGTGSHMQFLQTHSESGILKANVAALETDFLNLKRHAILLMNDPATTDPVTLQLEMEWPDARSETQATSDFIRQGLVQEKEVWLRRNEGVYRRSLPSFVVSGMLMQEESGMRMYGAMVGLSVPLYSNGQRRSLTRDYSLSQGQSESELAWHDQRKNLALVQAKNRIIQIEANVLALRREIIPPVREHIEAAIVQFSQGQADIGSIIEGRRTLLNLQVTEILTSEALAIARVGLNKINAGLMDMEIDLEVPQLAGPGSADMGNNMGGASGMSDKSKSSIRRPVKEKSGVMENTNSEEDEPAGGSSGMGM